jgi:hypothetical protein
METGWMHPTEWRMWGENRRLRAEMRSTGLREVRGDEAPEASGPDFTDVTVPLVSPSNVKGEGVELGASGSGG